MKRLVVMLACLVLVVGACTSDGEEEAAEAAPAGTPGVEADFTVTAEEYSFDMPAEVEGGVVTMEFANTGKLVHEALIVEVGSTTPKQVAEDLRSPSTRRRPIRSWSERAPSRSSSQPRSPPRVCAL